MRTGDCFADKYTKMPNTHITYIEPTLALNNYYKKNRSDYEV
jgi:hypothetical protein